MTEAQHIGPNPSLVTPRAAAVAGIIFSLLMGTAYALFQAALPIEAGASRETMEAQEGTIALALGLVPFAGIAYLWFMGVLRDRLGQFEDQFFSTLFLGSGLLYLAMTFAAAAVAGALLAFFRLGLETIPEDAIYMISRLSVVQFSRIFAMRMAGMHMLVSGTIWMRTGVIHRWLVLATFAFALILIFGVGFSVWLLLVFPGWVFVISVYILIWNYRRPAAEEV
ncbi:MAG: hypothetical protein R3335_05370 [Anaerolineales bacterium]|nr:hypothetical protein [Anaerolineales bacterium]